MRKLKRLLATLFTGTLLLSSMTTVFGAQDASGLADGTAYLNINNADWGDFDAEWTNAEITGDGTYTVAMSATEGQSLAQFNALEVVNGESVLGTGCVLTVDSIKINGEDVELTGSSYTCSADGEGVTTRVNIYNEWNAPDDTATVASDGHLDQRVAEGDLMDATACLFSSDYIDASSGSGFLVESLEVTFTVTGYGTQAGAGETEAASADAVDLDGTYHAYLGIQTPLYSFRNAYDDETYGYGTDYFNQITGWEGSDAVTLDGTITDTEIAGNGTYTVSITGMNFGDDEFADQDYFNLIFLSTDIPNTGEITISDIVLTIDGSTPSISPIISPDSETYLNMLIQNIWNDDVATIGYYSVPPTDISITFTVSGFNYDNENAVAEEVSTDTEEADTEDAAVEEDEDSESSISTAAVVVIVIIVIVVIVVIAVVASRKKKN